MVSLPATGWNEDQIKTFRRHCAEQMTRDGYTEDESYRVPPSGMATPPLPAPAPAPTEFRIAARWQETLSRLVTIPLKSR